MGVRVGIVVGQQVLIVLDSGVFSWRLRPAPPAGQNLGKRGPARRNKYRVELGWAGPASRAQAEMKWEEVTLSLNRKDKGLWGRQAGQAAGPCAGLGERMRWMEALATGCSFRISPQGSFVLRGPWS